METRVPPSTSTVVDTVVEKEEDREKHWERVKQNEERLRAQRRLVERATGHRFYQR